MGKLTDTDWEYFIMWISSKKVLRKTVSRYIGQARRLLQFFGFRITKLKMWEETTRTFGRVLDPKPKKEYFALEWRSVQKICEKTRKDGNPYVDYVIGIAILTNSVHDRHTSWKSLAFTQQETSGETHADNRKEH